MDDDSPLPRIDTEELAANAWWRYRRDRYRAPDGSVRTYHYVRTTDSVMIVPWLDPDHVVLVRQFRYLDQRWGLELPGGGLGEHGDEAAAAVAELAEETGYRASTWRRVGAFSPCKGVVEEISGVWIAEGLCTDPRGARPEVAELVEVVVATPDEVDAAILGGAMTDGMSIAAWQIARLRNARPETAP